MLKRRIKKVKKRIVFLLGLLILFVFGLWKINKNYYPIWNSNNINVTADSPITTEKVKIELGFSANSKFRENDTDLFKMREKYTTLYDDGQKEIMINDNGENDFLITYDNKYYFSFRQFKSKWKHQHDYNFHFYQKDNQIFVKTEIIGQDALKFNSPMIDISLAGKYKGNEPLLE
jgi:hypothetical protein